MYVRPEVGIAGAAVGAELTTTFAATVATAGESVRQDFATFVALLGDLCL